MRTVDYICKFLEKITDSIFLVSGGGHMYTVDAIGRSNLESYCCHHEQACALAAEGYARQKNDIGVCAVTTGPGGTNAITGVAAAWLDGIPMMVLSGQVREEIRLTREDKEKGLRQIGPQELNILDIVKPITKYSKLIENTKEIRYELEKAVYFAKTGQPGPVWLDIPIDIQKSEINPRGLEKFIPPLDKKQNIPYDKIVWHLNRAKKPLMIVGQGVRLSNGVKELWELVEKTKINVVSAMSGTDLINRDYPYYLGDQGITGNESANYAMDNCDLLLILGTRMQMRQTSWDYKYLAQNATKIMVDISKPELEKKTLSIDMPICADAREFLMGLNKRKDLSLNRWDVPIKPIEYEDKDNYINIYRFFEELGKKGNFPIVTANGMAAEASHQAVNLQRNQRLITNTACGEMGKGLPMAVGVCVANKKNPVICLEGDGSIMMNIQELQTISYHKLPIKTFILNNGGYMSIRKTHLNYFNKNFAADETSGVGLPDWSKLAPGWGIRYERIGEKKELYKLDNILQSHEPVICELMIDPNQKILPRWGAKK
jgi:acetolactate synthase-1/2/3 large subunit